MRTVVFLVLAAIVTAAAILWWRESGAPGWGRSPAAPVAERSQSGLVVARGLSADVVLEIKPGNTSPQKKAAPAIAPALQEFAKARSYRDIHARLSAKDSPTAEEQWMLATILDQCATVAERKPSPGPSWRLAGAKAREEFVASISEKDPNRARRIAAFDEVGTDPCEGLTHIQTSEKDIRALLEAAAASGDEKAQALLIEKKVFAQWEEGRKTGAKLPSIDDADIETAKRLLASNDPYAAPTALGLLTMTYGNFSLRGGPSELQVDNSAMWGARTLLACELGLSCGPDSRKLLEACALRGQCGANDMREYLFFYASTPASSQMIGEYLDAVTRARAGDWSYFTFRRGPASNAAAYQRR